MASSGSLLMTFAHCHRDSQSDHPVLFSLEYVNSPDIPLHLFVFLFISVFPMAHPLRDRRIKGPGTTCVVFTFKFPLMKMLPDTYKEVLSSNQ